MLENIWQEDDIYYKLAPLTDKEVEKAEKQLGFKLPQSYINLLKLQNGGYINYDSFPTNVPTSWAEDHINIDHILGIGEENSILESEYLIHEWGLPENVVLISGSGHTWVAFDYRNTNEHPPIIYIDVEADQIIELASDFDAFLNGLYEEQMDLDDSYFELDVRHMTQGELDKALSTTNEQEIIVAMNYLYENINGNEHFIEQKLMVLLQNPVIEIRQIAANFVQHFKEMEILSAKGLEKMVSIIRNDHEIEYYAEMYFSEK